MTALYALAQPFDGRHFHESNADPPRLLDSDAPPLCRLRADLDDLAFFQAAFGTMLFERFDHDPILTAPPPAVR